MGLDVSDMLEVIAGLTRSDCIKAMTTYADHTLWQDVYHADTFAGVAYIKFTLLPGSDNIVIQFKER